jgi:hypothetical protein
MSNFDKSSANKKEKEEYYEKQKKELSELSKVKECSLKTTRYDTAVETLLTDGFHNYFFDIQIMEAIGCVIILELNI